MDTLISPLISLCWIIAMIVFIGREELWATIVVTFFALVLFYFGTNLFVYLSTVPWYVGLTVIIFYIIAGVLWMGFKWNRFAGNVYTNLLIDLDEIKNEIIDYLPKDMKNIGHNISNDSLIIYLESNEDLQFENFFKGEFEEDLKEKPNKFDATHLHNRIRVWKRKWADSKCKSVGWDATISHNPSFPLKSKEFLDQIAMSGMWWPFSFFWTVLSDFIVNFWRNAVNQISSILDGDSKKNYRKTFMD